MNGILCIDKPQGFTSHDVVAKCRGILGTRKIGHGGTLDPMATGVLPLFVGRATKACDILPVQDKHYTAEFELGVTTDTQDTTGNVLSRGGVNCEIAQIEEVIRKFIGEGKQVPPMYSAVQVGGQRLYDLARQGIEVEREPRAVIFHSIAILGWDADKNICTIAVHCSKGAYIRTLCHDIGRMLGCGAALSALRRTAACGFALADCITLEQAQGFKNGGALEPRLLPVEAVFSAYPKLKLNARQTKLFTDGVRLSLRRLGISGTPPADYRVFDNNGGFIGIAAPKPDTDDLIIKKWFGVK
ncbi:MAG: tRNA pseudouridine(55) synthase TruB [Oscillospiraceae bacterium]|nr:tRNA pseudouridine(55) synthase TruB [Oscillospiraceae bacterium]